MAKAGLFFANITRWGCHHLNCCVAANHLKHFPPLVGTTLTAGPYLSPNFIHRQSLATHKSKYPPLEESELEEKFTRGGGPGGQATNTTSNCVLLKHLPTGLVIKCHAERSLELNRKIARRRMQEKLDFHWNGENSIISQEKLKAKQKLLKRKAKTKKKLELLAAEKALGADLVVADVGDTLSKEETEQSHGDEESNEDSPPINTKDEHKTTNSTRKNTIKES